MNLPFDEYCQRIGVASQGVANEQRLEELHRGQLYNIPFENFDLHLGRSIDFSTERLVEKLVRSKRGGYCFELNGLLLTALECAGFRVRSLLARVHISGEASGRGHQLGLLSLAGREWLVDVGFGGPGLRAPMLFECQREWNHDGRILRLTEHPLGYMLQFKQADAWRNIYSFDLMPVIHSDLVFGNYFTSTCPDFRFAKERIAIRSFPEGNRRLRNFTCVEEINGEEKIYELSDSPAYLEQLRELFDIELDADYDQLKPLG